MNQNPYKDEIILKGKRTMPLRKKDMYEIIKQFKKSLGDGFEVAPLKRSEGGITILKVPGMENLFEQKKLEILCKISTGSSVRGNVWAKDDWNETWKSDESFIYPMKLEKPDWLEKRIYLYFQSNLNDRYNGASHWEREWAQKFVNVLNIWGIHMNKFKNGDFKSKKKPISHKKE